MTLLRLGEVLGAAIKAKENNSEEPTTDGLDKALSGLVDPADLQALRAFERLLESAGFWQAGAERIGAAIKKIEQSRTRTLVGAVRAAGVPAPTTGNIENESGNGTTIRGRRRPE